MKIIKLLLEGGVFLMGRKNKISPELKIEAVKEYLNGQGSEKIIANKYEVARSSLRKWIFKYKSIGASAFEGNQRNKNYTTDFKNQVIKAYLDGEGSLSDIAIKYKIPSWDTVRSWIMKYNSHESLKPLGIGGNTIMTTRRKTTFNERVKIVEDCIENQYNYNETAIKYEVSYQQVYSWTRKYEQFGVEALRDKRGKRKKTEEMSEIEKLRAQNRLLEAQNKRQQMEIDFLKKLEEIERRRS